MFFDSEAVATLGASVGVPNNDVRDIQELNYSIPTSNVTIQFFLPLPPLLPLLPLPSKTIDYFFSWKSLNVYFHLLL